jgi:hypothetical protein
VCYDERIMASLGKLVFVLLIVTAALVWVTQVHPAFAINNQTNAQTAPIFFSLSSLSVPAIAAEHPNLDTFDGDGVVFIDTTSGTPGTPYLAYETPKHTVGIKELLFLKGNEEACQITAGEYPCARDITGYDPSNSDASPVPSGTPVHIVGGVDDQGIVVQSLQGTSTPPTNMILFTTPLGSTTNVSNGTTVMPVQVLSDASCTIGVGCYGSDTPRLETTISYGKSTTTADLLPGSIFRFGKSSVILISINGTGSAEFLVGSN